ncbi:c-type cytochrome [Foetidibacter luteolus]|uniref:c-type cytochrome n=1 Tax=Foetidibacter luteolus TaxID=2608880 RepID=UPI00129B25EF|nr:c-type cytochrome [Foetidibacter luteolus]
MKKTPLLVLTALSIILLSCGEQKPASGTGVPITQDSLVKRGQYLVTVLGCSDCHTPKKMGPQGPFPDPELELSGHPAAMPLGKIDTAVLKDWVLFNMTNTATVGPWGISFSANLTPDESGIGSWTEAQFIKAIREGKSKGLDGTRPILPPMPWPSYAKATDEDLKAVFAYLKSIKPVKNVVPQPVPPTQLSQL